MADTPAQVEDVFLSFLGDDPKSPKQIRTMTTKQIEKDPVSAKAWTARAWANLELEEFDDAIADATKAIELCPDSYLPWYVRGASNWMTDRHEHAERDLSEAIRLSDSVQLFLEDCYRFRGGIRCDSGRAEEALADLNACLKIRPDDSWAYVFRGNAHCRQKDYQPALKDYEKALKLDAEYSFALGALAWFLATCPDAKFRNGARALELATAANDVSNNEHLDDLAAAYAEVGDFKNAVKVQKRAIKKCGNEVEWRALEKRLKLFEAGKPYRDE